MWKLYSTIDWLDHKVLSLLMRITRTPAAQIKTTTYVLIGLLGALFISVKFGLTLATLWWSKKRLKDTSRRLT